MKVKIRRINKGIPLPKYETNGAVGFDFVSREDVSIKPKELGFIPSNVSVKTPEGYMLLIALRSSAPRKKGLMVPHGIGIVDQDYCGNDDEIKIQVYNFTDKDVHIEKGERVAQGVFVRVDKLEFDEVDDMGEENRGGFGSTGIK